MSPAVAERDNRLFHSGVAGKTCRVPDDLQIVEMGHDLEEGQFLIRVIDPKAGDKRIVWNPFVIPEINAAKKMFLEMIQEGMRPYVVGPDGRKKEEIMIEFDPSAGQVIMSDEFPDVPKMKLPKMKKGDSVMVEPLLALRGG